MTKDTGEAFLASQSQRDSPSQKNWQGDESYAAILALSTRPSSASRPSFLLHMD